MILVGTGPDEAALEDLAAALPGASPCGDVHPGARGRRRLWNVPEPPGPGLLAQAVGAGWDVCCRPETYEVGCVSFDGDGTLLEGETIDELARRAGAYDAVATITRRAMEGELEFAPALRERVAQLAGLSGQDLEAVSAALPWQRGVEPALAGLVERGVATAVFSGGFHFLLDARAPELGLTRVVANRLEVEAGRTTGALEGAIVDAAAKAEALREWARSLSVPLSATCAVGDGANDLPMLRAAGLSIGFRPKPVLLAEVDGVIASGDMRALLDFLAPVPLDVSSPRG